MKTQQTVEHLIPAALLEQVEALAAAEHRARGIDNSDVASDVIGTRHISSISRTFDI
jgi:hypothetical protein